MNFSFKCLHCKCRKWLTWGKFCRQCLGENDECIAGNFTMRFGGKKLGNCTHVVINRRGDYKDVRKPETNKEEILGDK